MSTLTSDRLRKSIPQILDTWEKRALTEIESAYSQGSLALRDSLPEYLNQLCDALSTTIVRSVALKRFDKDESQRVGKLHGKGRADSYNYTIAELILEYHILRQVICDELEKGEPLTTVEREIIVSSIEQAVSDAASEFSYTLNTQATELKVANQELIAFSYSVSHDLRAPLRSMDGFSQLLMEKYHDQLDETGKDYLSRIKTSSQKMAKLVDDLLLLSRIGRKEILRDTVDLSQLVTHILNRYMATLTDRKINLSIEPVCIAKADSGLLRIVLENLLSNALKFTNHRPVTEISLTCRQSEHYDQETVFSIKDNGVGFDMNYVDQLFMAFRRLHSVKDYPGSGIGLATVKNIIERHHGKIWAESPPEGGATFSFTLGQKGETP